MVDMDHGCRATGRKKSLIDRENGMPSVLRAAFFLLAAQLATATAFAGQTLFAYYSEPGDYIGGGQQGTLTTDDVDFIVGDYFGNMVYVHLTNNGRQYQYPIDWFMAFLAPGGVPLTAGNYEGAMRWPFQSTGHPGLDVNSFGRGCNGLTGRFQIREIVRNATTNKIERFAADFEQHCEAQPAALFGSVRINSDVPVSVRIPPRVEVVSPLNYMGCVEATGPDGARVEMQAVQSQPGNYTFSWSTTTGLTGTGVHFAAQVALDDPMMVTLSQYNQDTNERTTVTAAVCTSDTTPPMVEILSPADGSTVVGRSFPMSVRITDAVDKDISTYNVFLGYSATLPINGETSRVTLPNLHSPTDSSSMMIQVSASDSRGNTGWGYSWVYLPHDSGH
jgi:hypothetical protein